MNIASFWCDDDDDDDDVSFVLDQLTELELFLVVAHWNNSPRIDMSPHSDILSWFQANQSFLFLLNAMCLAEKKQIRISVFGFTLSGPKPTIYRTRGEHANHYITDAVLRNRNSYIDSLMVFNATFNNISVMSLRSVLLKIIPITIRSRPGRLPFLTLTVVGHQTCIK